ncbi:hypothetical protein [Shinella zoogloeoides]|uniref:Mu-like prophage FluMu N-terminal domain-containing protein n=1 Tax=Shinella zoogloeoides TaxID=352475 RepID=A0A6N8THB8_SHIZO|nr:hypothetical protein [Shinella zoogloeoides]MXO01586.1 hypothetical protein [Shinella zoogloeoides]UEX80176.1 hypothetical protein K8M09_11105 [Shinella zoogloeoides]
MAKQSTPAEKVATNDQATGGPAGETLQNDAGAAFQAHEHKGPTEGGETRAPASPEPGEDDGEVMQMIAAEQVLVVSAPGGPRRRAGFGFGPVPVDLRWEELGADNDERKDVLERLRADPLLKIDSRFEERPAEDD